VSLVAHVARLLRSDAVGDEMGQAITAQAPAVAQALVETITSGGTPELRAEALTRWMKLYGVHNQNCLRRDELRVAEKQVDVAAAHERNEERRLRVREKEVNLATAREAAKLDRRLKTATRRVKVNAG
jgi:hypothetical protein